ncbi:hypothetical protein [Ruminococcus difficilis]|uniref:hypothetical protein n=1 Tax=Ruminococcus difficilis TaxID=2763069 RepID=UPI001A9CB142|nr:hypothetical protein [Ruminococcus difficilis]
MFWFIQGADQNSAPQAVNIIPVNNIDYNLRRQKSKKLLIMQDWLIFTKKIEKIFSLSEKPPPQRVQIVLFP